MIETALHTLDPQNSNSHVVYYWWDIDIIILNVLSDTIIASSFFVIAVFFLYFSVKRSDLIPPKIRQWFLFFIVLSGLTHVFDIWSIWHPNYAVGGSLKLLAGGVAAISVLILWKFRSDFMAIPSFFEIGEQKKKLELSQEFMNAVLDSVTDGIVACKANGELMLFNRATRQIHGVPEAPVLPTEWAEHYDLYMPTAIPSCKRRISPCTGP